MGQRGQRRMKPNPIKKDRQGVQGIAREIAEESHNIAPGNVQRNRNRDVARGDWDRTSRRHDEGRSRDDEADVESRPVDRYPGGEQS